MAPYTMLCRISVHGIDIPSKIFQDWRKARGSNHKNPLVEEDAGLKDAGRC